jgi:hypothetical protein
MQLHGIGHTTTATKATLVAAPGAGIRATVQKAWRRSTHAMLASRFTCRARRRCSRGAIVLAPGWLLSQASKPGVQDRQAARLN